MRMNKQGMMDKSKGCLKGRPFAYKKSDRRV